MSAANKRRWPNVGLMLAHRLRRRPSIKETELPSVFAASIQAEQTTQPFSRQIIQSDFSPFEVVSRSRDPQLQVSGKYSDLTI